QQPTNATRTPNDLFPKHPPHRPNLGLSGGGGILEVPLE
ncbi:MAG: hypothetical protein JWQ95_3857, partial [Sphaerisporangium sp.]|nr:hypothetical protein [Sphaerisporangium sp.]